LLQRAVELDPSNAQAHIALGAALARIDRLDDGIKSLQFGIRSSPKDFRLTLWNTLLAFALGRNGRLDDALDIASAVSRRDGRLYSARVVSAWALQRLQREAEARAALAEARRIRPVLSIAEIERFFGRVTAKEISNIWA
jgi:Flp pilus assembly protein TadD